MSVHYKFKSTLDFDTITFDGLHISVADLKKAIIHQKRLGKTMDFDLQITNAQTKEEYSDDSTLIPKNTSLTIARVPLKNAPKKNWEPKPDSNVQSVSMPQRKGHDSAPGMQTNVDLSTMSGSEEDKIREMMYQSTAEYDPTNYQKIRGASQTGEVPSNYKCFRCHKPGHWIKNCPLGPLPKDAMEVKRTSGIPRSFIERDKDPENNPTIQPPQAPPEEKQAIPEDLICGICKDLFTDAVMIPCCGSSFCDECVRTALLESEDNECPDCKEKGSSPGSLIPNRFLRNSVNAFRNATGYTKTVRKAPVKENKVVEEVPPTAVESNVSASGTVTVDLSADTKHSDNGQDDKPDHKEEHCDLHESYEEVSQHGDVGSPAGDDKAFDNESDYEDNITVTVPPPHLQSWEGALQGQGLQGHFNGRPGHHSRYETPPVGRERSSQYSSSNSSSGGSRSNDAAPVESESRNSKVEEKENNYNSAPVKSKRGYGSRSPDYHQPSGRAPVPMSQHGPPHQPPMGNMPPHSNYMNPPHPGPTGPYSGQPHGGPHPYPPGGYGMQPGYPPQRPYDHHPGGVYHGERPRMMYPPRPGYPHHPPHMRPRHMAPMVQGGYPSIANIGPGIIDDPLEEFNRLMREKERRKEQEAKHAKRHHSPHSERNRRSRSFDTSGNNRRGRSTERERRRSPRTRTPDRRRTPDDKHTDDRDRERERDRDRDRERERERERPPRRRNRSSSYSSSGSRSYSRSPSKRGKSPKRRSRSPYRERRSRSRSKSFDDRRQFKHNKERREDRSREEHRGEYRENRERSPGYNTHYSSGYRGRGYRGGPRGRGGRDGGYQPHFSRGFDRGHMQGPPMQQQPQHDQYGHPIGPGPTDYHHHEPHHGVPAGADGMSHGVPPAGHYPPPQTQQGMAPNTSGPSRYPPREAPRVPYMGHPVKPDSMGYYEPQPQPVPVQQPAPINSEPPPPGFEEQDTWSGKQEVEYRPPPTAAATASTPKPIEDTVYDYHNTPKRDHDRAHTPIIHDDRHDLITRSRSKEKETKKKSREVIDEHRRDERRAHSKTPDREKLSKRVEHDKEKEKEKKRNELAKEKRIVEKEKEKESKRRQRDSSEEERKEKKKDKEKKKRKKEKEAEKKKHKKERKERDKERRSKESKKERKTVEKEEADSSQQPATPKHAPLMSIVEEQIMAHEERQQVDTTQEYVSHEFDETLLLGESVHNLSNKTTSEGEDISYQEEPSSSHDQQEQHQSLVDTTNDHSDLYSDIPDRYEGDQLEKSVLEGHICEEDVDLVNSTGTVEDHPPEDIKRSDSILDLHANLDFEADLEEGEVNSPAKAGMFIGIPELSKWEIDEDTPVITSTERKPSIEEHVVAVKHEDTKVTNEVLKRAENAIFTRAINAIRPIEIKKISVDRQKLYANDSLSDDTAVLEIKAEKQQDELKRFQVTIPTNNDNAERSVEIKPDLAKSENRVSPVRGSIKERLGSKITEVRGSSSSTYSRSRTPPPVRKVKASSSTSIAKLEPASRKRSRSRSAERDTSSARKGRNEREERHREEIRISSRRQDSTRRVVVAVLDPSAEKRREQTRKERSDRRSKDRSGREERERNRDQVVRRSRERSREKRRERSPSPARRDRERERDRERDKDRRREQRDPEDRHRKGEFRSRKSPEKPNKDDRKLQERKRMESESVRRHHDASLFDKDRRDESSSRKDEARKRFIEELSEKVSEATKKNKSDKTAAKAAKGTASSSDSSSSNSDSSSSDSSSDSDEEATRKRKKRKHKKERKRAKRSASTESDESNSKKKKKSKKSKSSKKKKKEKKHRKE